MSQINVNPTHDHVEPVDTSGDRTAAAGINLITVLIVLAVLAVIAWYLFTGPLRATSTSGGQTNINVNPPAQPQAPAPGGNTGTGNTGTGNSGTGTGGAGTGSTGGTGNTNPPSNP
jgi:hypothetical protein